MPTLKEMAGEWAEPETQPGEAPDVFSFLGMPAVVASARMRETMRLAERIAQSNAAVLITGESGCGKELVARAVHHYSSRRDKPWIDINCASLPDHLLESELFGFEKGAFSGADSSKPGMFDLAHQGTLFLDEISELNPKSQSKLLRVLDGYPHYRLGGTRKIVVDVRIVAASNANLEEEVRIGRFRADLFHRLNQARIAVPPLRERPEDIGPLARHFLQAQDPRLRLTDGAVECLLRYPWPGNIREVKNLMARLAVLVRDVEIRREDLPPEFQATQPPPDRETSHSLDRLEQEVIFRALEQADGRRSRAAELLGISRRTLIRRLKTYGVNPSRPHACAGMRVN